MSVEEMISLECPHCKNELYQPLTWFKEPSFICPACGKMLTAGEFATTIAALEEAMDAYHAEMINGETPPATGCCGGGKGHCGGKGH